MQKQHLFEYAVIRVVPRVEREEFINVGVIVYCKPLKFLEAKFELHTDRLLAFCKDLDLDVLNENLRSFVKISAGGTQSGPIGQLDAPSRFRWLTATRSTVLQTSKTHAGFCADAGETLEKLFAEMVI